MDSSTSVTKMPRLSISSMARIVSSEAQVSRVERSKEMGSVWVYPLTKSSLLSESGLGLHRRHQINYTQEMPSLLFVLLSLHEQGFAEE